MHRIGNSFTRLQPVNAFSQVAQQNNVATKCVLGNPPARLAAVHSPALVNAWEAQLMRCLAEPTQVERRKGHRRVQVLGMTVFDFARDGNVQVYLWKSSDNDLPVLVRLAEKAVVVQGGPHETRWMKCFKAVALRCLQRQYPGQAALCKAYVAWAHRKLVLLCWGQETRSEVRQRIATSLAFDAQLLESAGQIQLTRKVRRPVRLDAYNHVVWHQQGYRTLLKEAPQLIPLYALLADELDVDPDAKGEVTARIKTFLIERGVRPATWRLLCRGGTQWMTECLAYYDFHRQTHGRIALDLLVIAEAFGSTAPLFTWLLHALLQLGGNPNAPHANFSERLGDLFPLCARLGHLVAKADDVTLALLQDNAYAIFNWASDHLVNVSANTLRRASAVWLVNQVRAQEQLEALQRGSAQPWEVPYQIDLGRSDVSAVVLDSALAVWQEGQLMRHCADNYVPRCASGRLLMVSLRSEQQTRPLATVAFNMSDETVKQQCISGFANRLVNPEIHSLAAICRRQLRAQQRAAHASERQQRLAA